MGLTDSRQKARNITDYRQNAKKITDYRHGPTLSIFFFRKEDTTSQVFLQMQSV